MLSCGREWFWIQGLFVLKSGLPQLSNLMTEFCARSRENIRGIILLKFEICQIPSGGPCCGAPTGFMAASGGVLSKGYGDGGPGSA